MEKRIYLYKALTLFMPLITLLSLLLLVPTISATVVTIFASFLLIIEFLIVLTISPLIALRVRCFSFYITTNSYGTSLSHNQCRFDYKLEICLRFIIVISRQCCHAWPTIFPIPSGNSFLESPP